MGQKNFKLLRKIAKLTGQSDKYVIKTFKDMPHLLQRDYISFVRETIQRFEAETK